MQRPFRHTLTGPSLAQEDGSALSVQRCARIVRVALPLPHFEMWLVSRARLRASPSVRAFMVLVGKYIISSTIDRIGECSMVDVGVPERP